MKIFSGSAMVLAVCGSATPVFAQRASGFTIDLSLSRRAAVELTRRREGVTVSVSFFGEPTRAHRRQAVQGEIPLGFEEIQAPGRAGRIAVTTRRLQRARLSWVREPTVLINVFTSRRSGQDNLLDCGIVQEPIQAVLGRRRAVACKLIGE